MKRLVMLVAILLLAACNIRDVDGVLRLHVIASVKDANKQPVSNAGIYIESSTRWSKPQTTLICKTNREGRCDEFADHPFHLRNVQVGTARTRIDHRILIRGAGLREVAVPLQQLTRAQAEGKEPLVLDETIVRGEV